MKPRTLNVLKKLAHQHLMILQQEMAQLQSQRDGWAQRIDQLKQQELSERECTNILADGYFQNIARQKKDCLIAIDEIESQINTLQKQIVESWQKEEMLKMLPE